MQISHGLTLTPLDSVVVETRGDEVIAVIASLAAPEVVARVGARGLRLDTGVGNCATVSCCFSRGWVNLSGNVECVTYSRSKRHTRTSYCQASPVAAVSPCDQRAPWARRWAWATTPGPSARGTRPGWFPAEAPMILLLATILWTSLSARRRLATRRGPRSTAPEGAAASLSRIRRRPWGRQLARTQTHTHKTRRSRGTQISSYESSLRLAPAPECCRLLVNR